MKRATARTILVLEFIILGTFVFQADSYTQTSTESPMTFAAVQSGQVPKATPTATPTPEAKLSKPIPPFPEVPPDFYDHKRRGLVTSCRERDIKTETKSQEFTHSSGCRFRCDYRVKMCGDQVLEEVVLGNVKIIGGNYRIPELPACEANCLTGQPVPNCNDPAEANLVQSHRPTAEELTCPTLITKPAPSRTSVPSQSSAKDN